MIGRRQLALMVIVVLERQAEFCRDGCPEMELMWHVITQTVWDFVCLPPGSLNYQQAVIALEHDYLEPFCERVGLNVGVLNRTLNCLEKIGELEL